MKPFLLFPWDRPFLPALLETVFSVTGGSPEKALLILPNSRPRRYITDLYAHEKRPLFLPKIMTLEECAGLCLRHQGFAFLPSASLLDSVALLYKSVQTLVGQDPFLERHFKDSTLQEFWPWGQRLAGLLDEIWRTGRPIRDIANAFEGIPEQSQAICAALGRIAELYVKNLNQHQLSSFAYALSTLDPLKLPPELDGSTFTVFVCGFGVLDGWEERLIHGLWQKGCSICLHTDISLSHHAVLCHKKWIARFGASTEIMAQSAPEATSRPDITFFAGYDVHSELQALRNDLTRSLEKDETVAILPAKSNLLIPILHHLPDKNVNISIGYPLTRTLFGQFLQILLSLQERREERGYYWRDLLHLFRHPFLQNMQCPCAEDNIGDNKGDTERSEAWVLRLETAIPLGKRFQNPEDLVQELFDDERTLHFLHRLIYLFLRPFERPASLAELAQALEKLSDFLLTESGICWEDSPLELEAISRFQDAVLPALEGSLLSSEAFPFVLQKKILRATLACERIPFEADPLTGVQILGLFETRLLHFQRIFIVDCTDDLLPGTQAGDLILPEGVRVQTKLPSLEEYQERSEYTLFRLLAGAENVTFYWQEGVSRQSASDGKKSRSRFVEQLIWAEEERQGRVLSGNTPPLSAPRIRLIPHTPTQRAVTTSPALIKRLTSLCRAGLSSTQLDTFLTCPLRFARRYLLNLAPAPTLNEGEAPDLVGSFVHSLLLHLFTPFLGKRVAPGAINDKELILAVDDELKHTDLGNMPAVSYYVLRTAVLKLIGTYLAAHPPTRILELEQSIHTELVLPSLKVTLFGIIDRLDQREEGLLLIDYKTGSLKLPDSGLWLEKELFASLHEAISPTAERSKQMALLSSVRELLPSVQLPFYLVLLAEHCLKHHDLLPTNAALVKLSDGGSEAKLFNGEDLTEEERTFFCRTLVRFLVTALINTPSFEPLPGDACTYCPYAELCLL